MHNWVIWHVTLRNSGYADKTVLFADAKGPIGTLSAQSTSDNEPFDHYVVRVEFCSFFSPMRIFRVNFFSHFLRYVHSICLREGMCIYSDSDLWRHSYHRTSIFPWEWMYSQRQDKANFQSFISHVLGKQRSSLLCHRDRVFLCFSLSLQFVGDILDFLYHITGNLYHHLGRVNVHWTRHARLGFTTQAKMTMSTVQYWLSRWQQNIYFRPICIFVQNV